MDQLVIGTLERAAILSKNAKQAIAESKELQPYVLGDFYQLTDNSVDPKTWIGWQYHRPDKDDGYAVFFRRHDCPYSTMDASFRGVSADKKYEVRYFYGYSLDKKETLTGKELQNFSVSIPKKQSSVLIRYEVKK